MDHHGDVDMAEWTRLHGEFASLYWQACYGQARAVANEILRIALQAGAPDHIVAGLNNMERLCSAQGHHSQAVQLHLCADQVMSRARADRDRP
jgi:hypothetical protein